MQKLWCHEEGALRGARAVAVAMTVVLKEEGGTGGGSVEVLVVVKAMMKAVAAPAPARSPPPSGVAGVILWDVIAVPRWKVSGNEGTIAE